MDNPPVFRASKRRKFARHKDEDSQPHNDISDSRKALDDDSEPGQAEVQLADIIKLRKQNRSRVVGVQFAQQRRTEDNDEDMNEMALAKADSDEERLKNISNRFVGSTGQIVDVDKHMMAYIDSEMAKRQTLAEQESLRHQQQITSNTTGQPTASSSNPSMTAPSHLSQPQLAEIDLGPDAHQRNLARTEAAIARAQSGLPAPPEEPKPRRPRKPRLGRDGKPLRPRPRKRRNSEDIARDALVEKMLHEHKMDVYDGDDTGTTPGDDHEADEDADERLAEQFKQDFMDAMAERQHKHQVKAATAAAKAKGAGVEQTGPKLGGSRSARAKMAAWQQQQSQQQKSGGTK